MSYFSGSIDLAYLCKLAWRKAGTGLLALYQKATQLSMTRSLDEKMIWLALFLCAIALFLLCSGTCKAAV